MAFVGKTSKACDKDQSIGGDPGAEHFPFRIEKDYHCVERKKVDANFRWAYAKKINLEFIGGGKP